MKEYYIIKPITLNLEELIKKFPPDFNFNIDYAYWIINLILTKTAYRLEQNEDDMWISLCSQILNRQPHNYRKHIRYLCENMPCTGSVLYRNNYTKSRCYSYRISRYHIGNAVEAYQITDKKLLKYINRYTGITSNNIFKKSYNFLAKFFNPEHLKINLENALHENHLKYRFDYCKHLLGAMQSVKITNGEYNLKHTPTSDGRVHTEITRLPKFLRKHLRYDGKRLGEVDISASVPTMLYCVLRDYCGGNPHLRAVIQPSKEYYHHYMFTKSSVELDMTEVGLFGERLLSGDFYDSFIEEMHKIHLIDNSLKKDEYFLKNVRKMFKRKFDGDESDLRAVMKKNILSMFNAKPGYYKNEEYVFGKEYPSILKWIKKFKEVNHRYFSYLTLQTESYFMLDMVARALNKKHRGKVPILTLHDCIITTEDNLELVENFMKEVLTESMGFIPKMKRKVF